jgi:hypothetical protein
LVATWYVSTDGDGEAVPFDPVLFDPVLFDVGVALAGGEPLGVPPFCSVGADCAIALASSIDAGSTK